MASSTLYLLQVINDHYGNLLLLVAAIIGAGITYREYLLKRRPYVIPEIVFEKQDNNWNFHVMLANKGEYPAIAKMSSALMRIGDEDYPTTYKFETVLSPGEKQKLVPIGYINENGRKKILGHEYKSNRAEISVSVCSKSLHQRIFKYKTSLEYEVDVHGENPTIKLISESMN